MSILGNKRMTKTGQGLTISAAFTISHAISFHIAYAARRAIRSRALQRTRSASIFRSCRSAFECPMLTPWPLAASVLGFNSRIRSNSSFLRFAYAAACSRWCSYSFTRGWPRIWESSVYGWRDGRTLPAEPMRRALTGNNAFLVVLTSPTEARFCLTSPSTRLSTATFVKVHSRIGCGIAKCCLSIRTASMIVFVLPVPGGPWTSDMRVSPATGFVGDVSSSISVEEAVSADIEDCDGADEGGGTGPAMPPSMTATARICEAFNPLARRSGSPGTVTGFGLA